MERKSLFVLFVLFLIAGTTAQSYWRYGWGWGYPYGGWYGPYYPYADPAYTIPATFANVATTAVIAGEASQARREREAYENLRIAQLERKVARLKKEQELKKQRRNNQKRNNKYQSLYAIDNE